MKRIPLFLDLLVVVVVLAAVLVGSRLKGNQILWLFALVPILCPVFVTMQVRYDRWLALKRYKGSPGRKGGA